MVGEGTRPDRWDKALPQLPATTGIADAHGVKLYYEVLGAGHSLVLIHAQGLNRRMWDDQWAAFAKLHHVIRYDRPGYGKSERPEEAISGANELFRLLEYLNVEKAYVLGALLGGAIALDFTLEYPEVVDALVLVDPAVGGYVPPNFAELLKQRLVPWLSVWQEAVSRGDFSTLLDLMMDDPSMTSLGPALRQRIRDIVTENADVYLHPPPLGILRNPPAIQRLSAIRVPTLVIMADRSDSVLAAIADLLTANIAGARKVVVPGASYVVNMEQPEEFNRIVLDFLSQV